MSDYQRIVRVNLEREVLGAAISCRRLLNEDTLSSEFREETLRYLEHSRDYLIALHSNHKDFAQAMVRSYYEELQQLPLFTGSG